MAPAAELRYPAPALLGDLLRALAGTLASALPLVLARPPPWLALLLVALLLLFLAYLLGALRRAGTCYRLHDEGIDAAPGGVTIRWSALDMLRLDYYATRRDGRGGWFDLRLCAGRCTLRVDSRLAGFDAVLAQALRAAERRALVLAPATLANLHALGLRAAVPAR
jgi:hypothetical protein